MNGSFPEVSIAAPADEVWGVISEFGDMSWFPGTSSTTRTGDQRVHHIHGIQGGSVERLFHHDDVNRTYSYGLVEVIDGATETALGMEGSDPIELKSLIGHHVATLTVTPTSPSQCLVRYSFELDGDDEASAGNLAIAYQMALDNLKEMIEG
jgi:hypothetical protein